MTITVQEAARRLGVSVNTIKRRIYKGEIKAEKVGEKWEIDEESISNSWKRFTGTQIPQLPSSPVRANVSEIEIKQLPAIVKVSSGFGADSEAGIPIHEFLEVDDRRLSVIVTAWYKFIGTLQDGESIFKNGFKPDELIILSDGKLNLPACFNKKGHGGVYELPPYSPNDFKYADFKPIAWSKWLEVPKEIK